MSTTGVRTTTRDSPFQGLGYYTEADAGWFFGRESERKTIISNLRAAPLTLLYAESGVGKSSLLRAGVASRLREIAHRNAERGSPKFIPVVFSAWKDEPVDELIAEIEREANSFSTTGFTIKLARERLSTAIETASEAVDATFLIILDQFEEYFGYRAARNQPERLPVELAEAIAEPRTRVNFLVAIREDSYARLGDLFSGQPINVYGNYLHLEYLRRVAARAAIECPIEHFNATRNGHEPVKIEPALTDAVLDEVRRGRLILGQGVQDGNSNADLPDQAVDEIETPFLQVVMTRLWELEVGQGSRVLRKATLDELGGAETLVRTHLDASLGALAEDELAAATDIFHDLVTPSGAKIALTAADLATMTHRPEETVGAVLEKLDAGRVVRSVDPAPGTGEERYEIFHDRLAGPLLDWVGVRDNERLRREARTERRRANNFKALAIGAAVLFALALLGVVFAEIQKGRADQARRTSQSLQLAASAESTLAADPERSTLLALHAVRVADTAQAAQALRDALPAVLRVQATLHTGSALSGAAFSPDDSEVVTTGTDGAARIWSTATHRVLGVLQSNSGLQSAAFSPDGKEIVTAGEDGTARIWNTTSHQQVAKLSGSGGFSSAAFSPDGKEIVTAGQEQTNGDTAQIWSASSHRELGTLTEPNAASPSGNVVYTAAFSPDGNEIVTASEDGTARIWSASSYKQLGAALGKPQDSPLNTAAFSPDGTEIVTASEDGTARIWSANTHQQLGELTGPGSSELYSAAFSADGKEIVTASEDGTARVWSASNDKDLFVLAGHTGPVVWAAFSPDGQAIVTAGKDGTAKLWSAAPLEQLGTLNEPHASPLYGATFSSDGKTLLTASKDGIARLWNVATERPLGRLHEPATGGVADFYGVGIVSAAFSPDGSEIVTASQDGSARIWSAISDRQLGVLSIAGSTPLLSVAFSRDGAKIVTAGTGGAAQIWNATGHQPPAELSEPGGGFVTSAAFSPDGKEIVTASDDGTARIWSTTSHRRLGVLTEPDDSPLSSAAFSPDGKEIVTASVDGTARTWSTASHKLLGVLTEPDNSELHSAAFSPDGQEIVTASEDGTARIWNSQSRVPLTVFTGSGAMNYAAFSPDGKELVTASEDGSAQIWSTELAGSLQSITRIAEMRLRPQLTPAERRTYLGQA